VPGRAAAAGTTVEISESLHGTAFSDPNQPGVDFWFTFEGRFVFTSPLNGKTVVNNFAGAHLETLSGRHLASVQEEERE
jgi:hypothetical protein